MSNSSAESSENACVVCFKNVVIYSIGDCDHPVCYECSTRMRVLCRQNECPICRQDMPKVIFTKNVEPFKNIKNYTYLMDKKFKICFDNADIQTAYSRLLEHVCSICQGRPAFRTFQNLKDHMRKEHELYYCDLCVENLKIFTGERRCYTRQELALHRRKGDPDDRSHRGHPLCEFCEQRYMDNDELFRHLRRDHLFCHFCDADGFHQYYSSYDYLREHFRSEHFLCEEGGCVEEKFTSVFRSEIDLKAHRASVHGRTMGKAAAKQARTLELEFTLAPRPRDRIDGLRGGRRGGGRQRMRPDEDELQGAIGGEYEEIQQESNSVFRNAPNINTDCIEEFPTLSGEVPLPPTRPNSRKVALNNSGVTIRTVRQSQPLAVTDENFPALGPENSTGGCKTVRLSVNSGTQDKHNSASSSSIRGASQKSPANVSIHVNHRPSGSSQNIRIRPASVPSQLHDDFPSLSGSKKAAPTSVQWLANQGGMGTKVKPQQPLPSQPHPPRTFTTEEDFPSLSSKFSTGCSVASSSTSSTANIDARSKKASSSTSSPPNFDDRSKKASSVMIPVTSSWSASPGSTDNQTQEGSGEPFASGRSSDEVTSNTASSLGNIKVKSKKKKKSSSQNTSNDSAKAAAKEPATPESDKRKKKQGNADSSGQQMSQSQSKQNGIDGKEKKKPTKNAVSASNTAATERKRSELLIDSLTSEQPTENSKKESTSPTPTHNNRFYEDMYPPFSIDILDDFPTIGGGSSGSRPPGFEMQPNRRKLTSAPPPGFGGGSTSTGPPPGFSVTLNSVARPQTNGLTFTSSSGQSYSILPGRTENSHNFMPPQDFARRNQALVMRVRKVLDDPRSLDDFCQLSKMFRQGEITGADFYRHCQETMGTKVFSDIFTELLVLLPDIDKQQELWSVHTSNGKCNTHDFEVCATCQQVLSVADLRYHVSSHTLENHFPALGSSEPVSQTWGKK